MRLKRSLALSVSMVLAIGGLFGCSGQKTKSEEENNTSDLKNVTTVEETA